MKVKFTAQMHLAGCKVEEIIEIDESEFSESDTKEDMLAAIENEELVEWAYKHVDCLAEIIE